MKAPHFSLGSHRAGPAAAAVLLLLVAGADQSPAAAAASGDASCPTGDHDLYVPCTASTTHWGAWAASIKPVATVESGAVVRMQSFTAVNFWWLHEEAGHRVPEEMKRIHSAGCLDAKPGDLFPCGRIGPHLLTGPVYVEGAEPGDVLQVDVISVEPFLDWGWNRVGAGWGSLKYFNSSMLTFGLDLEARAVKLPWGGLLPWNITNTGPFFGGMGTAPPPEMGSVSSVSPWEQYGGNIDNKHLGVGTTVYFPVNVPGGLFSVGDGHAVQGDGEVCVTGMESSLVGDFRLTVRKDLGANGPSESTWVPPGKPGIQQLRAETSTHYISMAFNEDLDQAEVDALEDLLEWMMLVTSLSKENLYRLCSLAADMAVTQVVNIRKGIHILLPKAALPHQPADA